MVQAWRAGYHLGVNQYLAGTAILCTFRLFRPWADRRKGPWDRTGRYLGREDLLGRDDPHRKILSGRVVLDRLHELGAERVALYRQLSLPAIMALKAIRAASTETMTTSLPGRFLSTSARLLGSVTTAPPESAMGGQGSRRPSGAGVNA